VNPRPFELGACPRVRRRQAFAVRRALRSSAAVPSRWDVALPPMGTATVTFTSLDADPDPAGGVELPVSFGASSARVSIEGAFAVRLVDAILGGDVVVSAVRTAGPAERGVLAGLLAPVFDRVGGSLHLGPLRPREPDAVGMVFRLETVVASGWLRLTVPPGGLPCSAAGADLVRARAGRIPVTGHVEIAATAVPARALATLRTGDAVVFDGVRAAAFMGAPRDARLRVGDHAAAVALDGAGSV
jgi:hypothetical protein